MKSLLHSRFASVILGLAIAFLIGLLWLAITKGVSTNLLPRYTFTFGFAAVAPFMAIGHSFGVFLVVVIFLGMAAVQIKHIRPPFLVLTFAGQVLMWQVFGLWCLMLVTGGA